MNFSIKNPLAKRNAKNYNYNPKLHGVSQSMIETWLTCREKSRLATVHGWTSMQPSKPLTFGDLSHGTLEIAYNEIRKKRVTSLRTLRAHLPEYIAQSEARFWATQSAQSTSSKDLVEECLATLTVLLPLYFERWWHEDSSCEWLLVEEAFSVPLKMPDGAMVAMVGKFDGVIREGKSVGVFETKNKSQWSAELLDLLPLDLQLSYYVAALHKQEKLKPTFCKYNLIRRPGERRKQGESLKDFTERIGDNIRNDPAHYFERYEEKLSPQDIERYVARAEALVTAFYEWWKSSKHETTDLCWNSAQCENKYGTCNYLPICSKDDFDGHRIREVPSPELQPVTSKKK